jgi:hypothetical protein
MLGEKHLPRRHAGPAHSGLRRLPQPQRRGIPRSTRACRASTPIQAKQLAAFRDGSRGNSMPDARHLALPDGPEIKAVSDYIAGLR